MENKKNLSNVKISINGQNYDLSKDILGFTNFMKNAMPLFNINPFVPFMQNRQVDLFESIESRRNYLKNFEPSNKEVVIYDAIINLNNRLKSIEEKVSSKKKVVKSSTNKNKKNATN